MIYNYNGLLYSLGFRFVSIKYLFDLVQYIYYFFNMLFVLYYLNLCNQLFQFDHLNYIQNETRSNLCRHIIHGLA